MTLKVGSVVDDNLVKKKLQKFTLKNTEKFITQFLNSKIR